MILSLSRARALSSCAAQAIPGCALSTRDILGLRKRISLEYLRSDYGRHWRVMIFELPIRLDEGTPRRTHRVFEHFLSLSHAFRISDSRRPIIVDHSPLYTYIFFSFSFSFLRLRLSGQ